jgi:Fe-S-cluster-containing hydrogenase component 2
MCYLDYTCGMCVCVCVGGGVEVEEEHLRKSLTASSVDLFPQPERTKFPIPELHFFIATACLE